MVTGDIAWSGLDSQYDIAKGFFLTLKTALLSGASVSDVRFVIVPGNHDCRFVHHDLARRVLIESIQKTPELACDEDPSLIEACVRVQDSFFKSLGDYLPDPPPRDARERLYYEYVLSSDQLKIRFQCFNTAWISQLRQRQGQLIYPFVKRKPSSEPCTVAVSLFHHPYNWLEANNARAFRKAVELCSDIIMTGHEHDAASYTKSTPHDVVNEYIEGACLQNNDVRDSGFYTILFDHNQGRYSARLYQWRDGLLKRRMSLSGDSSYAIRAFEHMSFIIPTALPNSCRIRALPLRIPQRIT